MLNISEARREARRKTRRLIKKIDAVPRNQRVWVFVNGTYSRVRLPTRVPVVVKLSETLLMHLESFDGIRYGYELTTETGALVAARRVSTMRVERDRDAMHVPLGVDGFKAWETRGNRPPCRDVDLWRTEPG